MGKRVTIRGTERSGFEISYGGARIGTAHRAADGGPGWYVRSDDPPIALRNSWAEGLRYETAKQAAQDAAAYARETLKRATRPGP